MAIIFRNAKLWASNMHMGKLIENQYNPDYVSLPGDTLLETIQYLSMPQDELADSTGLPKRTISAIIQGKAPSRRKRRSDLKLCWAFPPHSGTIGKTNTGHRLPGRT